MMMTPQPPELQAILFDWDGTLLDSYESHLRVYRQVLAHFGMTLDEEDYIRHYSPDWYTFYERLGLHPRWWEKADRLWLQYNAAEKPPLRRNARFVLEQLQVRGFLLGLVTAGDRRRVLQDLRRLDLRGPFQVIVCGGDVQVRKPDPGPLLHALRQLDVAPSLAAYVGDTPEDVEMGRRAGVLTVAVLGGFGRRETLEAASPDLLVSSLEELLTFFNPPKS
jgi:phosphoglycolate phosphatase